MIDDIIDAVLHFCLLLVFLIPLLGLAVICAGLWRLFWWVLAS